MKDNNGAPVDAGGQGRSLRAYLYDKYVYRSDEAKQTELRPVSDADIRAGVQRPAAVAQISKIAG
jgi:hypothetical protein